MTSARVEIVIDCADGGGPTMLFELVPEPKTVKNRIHLHFRAVDGDQAVLAGAPSGH